MVKLFLKLGFRQVGKCQLDANLKSGVRFVVNDLANERVIYAYAVDSQVKYIGVCDNTTTTLKARMRRYQGMQGAGTNERITNKIKKCLKKRQVVNILAWKPDQELTLKGIKVDLIKGMENPLIQKFKPEWNTHS